MAYAELLCRSNFSFLRGASHPEELIEAAAGLGYSGLALADLDGVYGVPKAWWKAKDVKGFHLICGAELSLEDAPRGQGLVLLAKDRAGWALLCNLLTASHAGKAKGEAGLGWDAFAALAGSRTERQSLLCLPRDTCMGGWDWEPHLGELKELFGAGLQLPLARYFDGEDAARTLRARRLNERFGLSVIAVNDAHYHQGSRRRLQDVLTSTRVGQPLAKAGNHLFSNSERYLRSEQEQRRYFSDWPDCVDHAAEAASACHFSLAELRYRYPDEWIPKGMSAQGYLEQRAWEGARWRGQGSIPDAMAEQVQRELAIIAKLGFADYFLTIDELVAFARSKGILCQGRGSAANSAVCYCLGITSINPVGMGLLFERFMSEERAEPPDIDVDFEHERREEVLQHLYEKYGRSRAAMVAAVITYRGRSALHEVSKALGQVQRAGRTLRDLDLQSYGPELAGLAQELKGFPRHLSIHSGGFVLSQEPLIDLVPVEPARMEGRSIIQWDKYDLDYVGLMKVDVLALGMLSALRRCMDRTGFKELADIPPADPATYAMIQKADTVGVFQIESRAQMNMLGRLRPETFYDLVIQVAIVRPGPIVGKMVHPYLKRRQGREAVVYEHPALKGILHKTLGVPLFQEQVMRIAVELAGFSPGEADELRRAIGAWRSEGRLDRIGERLMAGLRAQGLSEHFVQRLFKEIQGFADYGFPESHAASFALLCYASSYLKCHHPAEFACALINSQPMGFYANHSLVDDAKRHGVQVLPLHPNDSVWDCEASPLQLRLGWRVLAGLGKGSAERLLAERAKQIFTSLDDFMTRSGLSPALCRHLALGDAFACFGISQRDALWRVLLMESFTQSRQSTGQMSFFSGLEAAEPIQAGFGDLGLDGAVTQEYRVYGLSTKAHPMQVLRTHVKNLPNTRAHQARQARHGQSWSLAGLLIVRQRPGEGTVVFATLEDETGLLDLVLKLDVYERYREEFLNHSFFCASGVLQRDRDSVSLLVKQIKALKLKMDRIESHDWH